MTDAGDRGKIKEWIKLNKHLCDDEYNRISTGEIAYSCQETPIEVNDVNLHDERWNQ